MQSNETPIETENGRKKIISRSTWQREKLKLSRYRATKLPTMEKCTHKGKMFKCHQIKPIDALSFSKAFYSNKNKIAQDTFILNYSKIRVPERRNRCVKNGSRKLMSITYFIRLSNGDLKIVCQKKFLGILNVGKSRVQRICKAHLSTGIAPEELRGGDRVSQKFDAQRQSIITFIKCYKTIEVHYCRGVIKRRQYLPSELSINSIWREYIKINPELKVKQSYFRMIFRTHFNLGFKAPSTDMCSKCLQLKEQIKIENNSTKKNSIMTELRIHKLRGKSFFEILNQEREGLLTISFDCQKNMVLPKVPDQAAYYSRQLYLYLFGMVIGTGHSKLGKENVFLYYWTENTHNKGSNNEISSAVYHKLCNLPLLGIDTVRLVADGCGGQNKNTIMIGMVMFWLSKNAPKNVVSVEMIFPVTGHSYIPPDRVFAQIEKKVKAKDTIIDVKDYLEIYNNTGTIIGLGNECPVKNFRAEVQQNFKPPGSWHFKFKESKRMIITRNKNGECVIRGETFYKSDLGKAMGVMKKGKQIKKIQPKIVPLGVKVKSEKLADVNKLLIKHFGPDWKENPICKFYKTVLEDNVQGDNELEADDDPICEESTEINIRI